MRQASQFRDPAAGLTSSAYLFFSPYVYPNVRTQWQLVSFVFAATEQLFSRTEVINVVTGFTCVFGSAWEPCNDRTAWMVSILATLDALLVIVKPNGWLTP